MKMKQDRQLKPCGKRIYLLYLILCTLWPWSIMIYLFICGQTMWPRISKALSRSSLVPLLLPEVRESDFEKTSQSLEGCLSIYTCTYTYTCILCPNIRESSLASKEPYTKYYKRLQKSFFQVALLSLGFGAWVLGSRLSHVANSVFSF